MRNFLQLDVFADRPGAGNPLAVVLDAQGMSIEQMQAFANWTNLSETSFLLPPSQQGADYQVRIFTPKQELPFAGHPSIGSAHAALEAGICTAVDGQLLQQCAVGLLPISVEHTPEGQQIFIRAPRAQNLAANPKLIQLAKALQIGVFGQLPASLMDNGPRWWCVQLADEASVRNLQPDLSLLADFTQHNQAVGVAVFAHCHDSDHQLVVRAFCPADGIPEDPVTGSANACIAALLHATKQLPNKRYTVSQGREIGRDGKVMVRVDDEGEVWIGGHTQSLIRGQLNWV